MLLYLRTEKNTFCTPEAKKVIDLYLDYRKRCGEQIDGESPLFRTDFEITDIQTIRKEAKAVSIATIKTIGLSKF
ncbi:MAG TPA: hypothetical protein VF884_00340 [Nitrososphaeraceae archaeon]